jgi:hypothetical protein
MYEELQGLDSVVEPYLEGVDICSGCGGIKHGGLLERLPGMMHMCALEPAIVDCTRKTVVVFGDVLGIAFRQSWEWKLR